MGTRAINRLQSKPEARFDGGRDIGYGLPMSRYEFVPDGWPAHHSLTLNWDRPWRAYVALVADNSVPPGQDKVILRVGCKPPHDRYPDLDDMMRALNAAIAGKLPAVTLSQEMRQKLIDQKYWHFADLLRSGIDPMQPLDFSKDDDDDQEEALGPSLAMPPLYLVRTAARCPECGQAQHVYTLGCAAYHDASDLRPIEAFHFLALIRSLPEALLSLLKTRCPSLYLDRDEADEVPYLMNHCDCGAKLDDDFLHGDVGAAFWPDTPEGYPHFQLFRLPIDEPIPIPGFCIVGGGEYLDFSNVW